MFTSSIAKDMDVKRFSDSPNCDITCLDTVNGTHVSLYEQVKSHTGMRCDMAQSIIKDIGVDVFIVENPPRYDPIPSDPTSLTEAEQIFQLSSFHHPWPDITSICGGAGQLSQVLCQGKE